MSTNLSTNSFTCMSESFIHRSVEKPCLSPAKTSRRKNSLVNGFQAETIPQMSAETTAAQKILNNQSINQTDILNSHSPKNKPGTLSGKNVSQISMEASHMPSSSVPRLEKTLDSIHHIADTLNLGEKTVSTQQTKPSFHAAEHATKKHEEGKVESDPKKEQIEPSIDYQQIDDSDNHAHEILEELDQTKLRCAYTHEMLHLIIREFKSLFTSKLTFDFIPFMDLETGLGRRLSREQKTQLIKQIESSQKYDPGIDVKDLLDSLCQNHQEFKTILNESKSKIDQLTDCLKTTTLKDFKNSSDHTIRISKAENMQEEGEFELVFIVPENKLAEKMKTEWQKVFQEVTLLEIRLNWISLLVADYEALKELAADTHKLELMEYKQRYKIDIIKPQELKIVENKINPKIWNFIANLNTQIQYQKYLLDKGKTQNVESYNPLIKEIESFKAMLIQVCSVHDYLQKALGTSLIKWVTGWMTTAKSKNF